MNCWLQRSAWRCGWLGLLLVAAGCGPARTEVSGTVRYQGKPLTSGHVIVVDADHVPHTSPIGPEGSYAVAGVPVGPVRFAVLPSKGSSGDMLPHHYFSPATSGLSTTLNSAPNTYDLDLQ